MNPKNTLTAIGVLNILQGIGFFIGAETLTEQSFPTELLEGGGLVVGTAMHWPLSVACIVIGIIILSTRSLEMKDAKKVLLSIGIAYLFFLINGLLQHFTTPVNVPVPAIGLIALISILAFYTALKKPNL
ncbi:hypothetical protein N9772_01740 [Bacteroidia bacterium]|jgi:hypothetical protein|nr:hypothetical protein [Bacteroidia bacterium]MDB9881840.1 hypothetical protein [Bacteroidia bacterium]